MRTAILPLTRLLAIVTVIVFTFSFSRVFAVEGGETEARSPGVVLAGATQGAESHQALLPEWLAAAIEKGQLKVADPARVSLHGTFWSIQNPFWPPFPMNLFPDLPLFELGESGSNSYLMWDVEVRYDELAREARREKARRVLQSEHGLSLEESEAVLESEEGLQWAMSLGEQDGLGISSLAYSYAPGTFYLEIGEVGTNAPLTLRGVSGENLYSVQSTETLTNSHWLTDRVVQGAAGQDWTELVVPVGDRTNNLFLRGLQIGESDASTNGLSVSLTSPADGAYYPTWPTNITMQATASSTNGAIVGVGFYAGSMLVGFDAEAPYQATWEAMRGVHALTARAFDSAGGSQRSAPVSVSVDLCYPAVDVVLVVDKSGSMTNPPTKLADAKAACSNFVEYLTLPADQAGLVSFSTTASTDRTLTTSQTALLTSIGQITGGGSTYMSNAIHAARIELTSTRRNTNALPVMVFFSDGEPTDSTNAVLAEAARAKTNDHIRIFTIGLGDANHALMRSMASTTNDYFYTTNSSELSGLFAAVAARLCRTAPVVEMVWPTNNATFIYPQVFNLQARATDADGGIASVRFCNGSQPVGIGSPVAGTNLWTFTWNGAALGTNPVTAVAVDNSGLESTSAVTTVVLTHAAPTIQITAPTNGQLFAYSPTNILLSADPVASGGLVTNVQFLANGQSIGHATAAPWQVLWIGTLAASNYTITAIATDFLGETASNTVSITVNARPGVAWISPTNGQQFIAPGGVPLAVGANDSDGSVTGVTFNLMSGQSAAGSANGTNFSLIWSNLAVGNYAAMAEAQDNRGTKSVSEVRVFAVKSTNESPEVWITWPTNGAVFQAGADLTITAVASNAVTGGVVTNVQFFADGESLGSDEAAPYSMTDNRWYPGEHTLLARAVDQRGSEVLSAPVSITITNPAPAPSSGLWDPLFGNPGVWLFDPGRLFDGFALTRGSDGSLFLAGPYMVAVDGQWNSTVARWDGTNWTALGEYPNCAAYGGYAIKAVGSNEVIVSADGGLAVWDGTNWTGVAEQLSGRIRSIAQVGGDIYVGGDFTNAGTNQTIKYIARLEGTNWVSVGDGLSGEVYALSSIGNELYAGGNFTGSGSQSNISYVARLQAGHWQALGSGLDGAVRSLAVFRGNLLAGGEFITAGGLTNANHIAQWNGSRWSTLGSGLRSEDAFGAVLALAVRGEEVFVGGRFDEADPEASAVEARNIASARWIEADQGWQWSALDTGLYFGPDDRNVGWVEALLVQEGDRPEAFDLIATGPFRAAGSGALTSANIARWRAGGTLSTNALQVQITAPALYQIVTNTDPVTVSASVTGVGNAISYVDFYLDNQRVERDYDAPFETVLTSLNPGYHKLLASARDELGETGQSEPILIFVENGSSGIQATADFYTVWMNGGQTVLSVLANDLSTNGPLRIEEVWRAAGPWGARPCGSFAVDHTATALIYSPHPDTFGKDILVYSATNAAGGRATASVEITVLAMPQVAITSPDEGDSFPLSTVVTILGGSRSLDAERQITNVTLFVNGASSGWTTNAGIFSFAWSNAAPGFYTFEAVATDSTGVSNKSPWVTITVTNSPSGGGSSQPPVAKIMNLQGGVTQLSGMELRVPPVIREGLFNLKGLAKDPDPADAVSYQVLLYRPQDWADIGDPPDLVGEGLEPFADVTPGPKNYQGFHIGGDVGGILGGSLSPETAGDLGQLDLTTVGNGVYDLVLRVRGGAAETNAIVRVQIESQLKIGQFSFSEQDLVIPVNGIPLTVTRTYSSLNPRAADFGHGWTYEIVGMDAQLDEGRREVTVGSDEAPLANDQEDEHGLPRVVSIRTGGGRNVTLTLPDGRRTTFAFKPRVTSGQAYAEWEAPPGVRATLKPWPESAGVINYYPWLSWAQGRWNSTFENYDLPGWVLETQDGTKYYIARGEENQVMWDDSQDSSGHFIPVTAYGEPRLTRIEQRSGDVIEIAEDAIRHLAGGTNLTRSVWFERDDVGRITAIRDPNSGSNGLPSVRYVYNRDTGNLIQVHRLLDRSAGSYSTNKYHYDLARLPHYITSIEDPRGVSLARNEFDDAGRLAAVIDADGKRVEFIHSISNRLELTIDRMGNTNTVAFDTRGNITATTNALGGISLMAYDEDNNRTNEIVFLNGQPYATNLWTYSPEGFLLSSQDALGYSNVFTYNQYGQVLTSRDSRGFETTNYYSERGELLGSVDALGQGTTNVYANGLLVGSRDAIGTWTTNAYDGSGNLAASAALSASGAILATNNFAHDANGNQVLSVAWRRVNGLWQGATNRQVLDAQDRVVQTIDPLGYTNTVVYSSIGKQEQTIDKLGRVTSFEYDWQGRLRQTTYPDLYTENSAFDLNGNRTNSVDRASRPTGHVFDALGRAVQTVFADGTINRTVFDDLGRVKFSVDGRGVTNAFGYDRTNRRTSVTNAWGTAQQMVYRYGFDENGNQVWTLQPDGAGTTNVFDPLNRLVETRFADGSRTLAGFDAASRRVAETNQDNVVTLFGHDGLGRLLSVTNALGTTNQTVTRYDWDEAGNQVTQVDALNRTNSFGFDPLGRRVWQRLPGGQVEGFAYDPVGNLIRHTNFNSVVITNQFDAMNRLWTRWHQGTLLETYLYSPTGRLTNRVDLSGTYTWVHDLRDRVRTNTTPVGTLYYTWDANANQLSMKSATANGVDVEYQYDCLNRLTNVVDNRLSGSKNTGYKFDLAGNLSSLKYPNEVTNHWQYNLLNRLTNLTWKYNGAARADFAYKLGSTGNRTNLSETVNGVSRAYGWRFDALYRLVSETVSGASPTGTLGYGFDLVGNRTTRSGTLGTLGSQTLAYSANDWLDNDANPNNGSTYFDANGNTVSLDGTWQYDWANRLTNFNGGTGTYAHDADGNRVKKTAGGVTTWYLVAAVNPSGYAQVVEEHTGASPGTLSRRYTYGLDLVSQSRWTGSAWDTHFYLTDGLGSTRALLNSSGNISDTYSYDAYGTLIASTGTTPNDYRFTGEQWDATIGQYYLRARTMHPGYGRFWTRDTWEGKQTDPLSLHKYLYCSANPVNRTDPSGLTDYELVLVYEGTGWSDPEFYAQMGYESLYGVADRFPGGAGMRHTILISPVRAHDNVHQVVQTGVDAEHLVAGIDHITKIVVAGHGSPGSLGTLQGGESSITLKSLQAKELTPQKQMLAYLQPFTKGNCTVYLQACYQGKDQAGKEMMQLIASSLGATVIGWDDQYAVWGWGNRWAVDPKGNWITKRGDPYERGWLKQTMNYFHDVGWNYIGF